MALDEIRKPHGQLVVDEVLRWDRKHLCKTYERRRYVWGEILLTIQLLKSQLLGLPDETEYHKPSDKVESGVETNLS